MRRHIVGRDGAESGNLLLIDIPERPNLLPVKQDEIDRVSSRGIHAYGAPAIVRPAQQAVPAILPLAQDFQFLLHIHGGDMQLLRRFRAELLGLLAVPCPGITEAEQLFQ